jgi:hypothetical protein
MPGECPVCRTELIECDGPEGIGCGARYCLEHGIQVPNNTCPLQSPDCEVKMSIEMRDAFPAPLP